MSYELTEHARTVLEERAIPVEWLERTLAAPEAKMPDPTDATLECRYRKIPEQWQPGVARGGQHHRCSRARRQCIF